MAWPPPTLPTNRTNAVPQQDTHPADHNAANLAINDIVGHMTGTGASQGGNLGKLATGAPLTANIPIGGVMTRMTADLVLPAGGGYFLVVYNVLVLSTAALKFKCRLVGLPGPGYFESNLAGATEGSVAFSMFAQAGATVSVHGINTGGGVVSCYADYSSHHLFAVGLS
jgi:hypothetical protein